MIQSGSVTSSEVAKRLDHNHSQHKQMRQGEGGGLANTNIVRNKFKSTRCIQTYTMFHVDYTSVRIHFKK